MSALIILLVLELTDPYVFMTLRPSFVAMFELRVIEVCMVEL